MKSGWNGACMACVLALTWALDARGQIATNEKAELPFWPCGADLPASALQKEKTPPDSTALLAWAPEKARRIRAVLLIVNNAASKHFGEHPALRAVAAKREMGVVYLRRGGPESALEQDQKSAVPEDILGAVAEAAKIPEFRYAPWITFGQSSRGRFPFTMAWAMPERTVATITHHAETPTWPAAAWARLEKETVLHCSMNGETEWGGTWHRHVRPSLLNYRARTAWLPHQAVAFGVAHQNEVDLTSGGGPAYGQRFPGVVTIAKMWDYLSVFVDKALALRLPTEGYPTDGPLRLRSVNPDSGWLIHPLAIEGLFDLPAFPLREKDGAYAVDPPDDRPPTFAAIAPATGYTPPEGVPVGPLPVGRGPSQWLLTQPLPFAMKNDPMQFLGELRTLRPKPGDTIRIDGQETVFAAAKAGSIADDGKVVLSRVIRSDKATLLAFTVLEVAEKSVVAVNVPFTPSGRVQAVLNGVKVYHRQIVELGKGLYPMLVALRLETGWAHMSAGFATATEEEIARAKERTEAMGTPPAEEAAQSPVKMTRAEMIRKASEVPEAERKRMFWVADEEQAEAWLRLHTIHKEGR
jgi:hypothetical protein